MKLVAGEHVTPNVRLVRPLGQGGMGEVWVAEHLALGTEVAVKFLLGDYATNESARARFSQEAAAAARVKSSHVVKIYDYGLTDTQTPFIVMELLEGTDLGHRIETSGPLPPRDVVAIISQLAKALERAHEKGVVHRDIKPENIFLGSEGGELFVKLLDFGIAKTEQTIKKMTTGGRRSTLAGETLGTPYYMSPEQFRSSKSIDFRSDLWSVGIVVYEALTGTLPFMADTAGALAILVNDAVAPGPSTYAPSLPKELDAWFLKACARDPQDRFQSARELADGLRMALGEAPMPSSARLDPGASGRQAVISAVDASELAHISLRETAFATQSPAGSGSFAGSPARRGRNVPALAALGVVLLLGAASLVVWRSAASNPRGAASAAAPALSTAAPPPSAPGSTVAAVAPTSDLPTTSPSTSASAAARPAVPPKGPATTSSAAPKGTTHERDIW